jgi:hypothetical protein
MPDGPIFRGFHPENCFKEVFWAIATQAKTWKTTSKNAARNLGNTIIRSFGNREIRDLFLIKIFGMIEGFGVFRHHNAFRPPRNNFDDCAVFNKGFRNDPLI